jgi:hypothetical protein
MKVNEELSLVDAQQQALHTWRSFCEVLCLSLLAYLLKVLGLSQKENTIH